MRLPLWRATPRAVLHGLLGQARSGQPEDVLRCRPRVPWPCARGIVIGRDIKVAYPGPELMTAWSAELQVPLVILGGPPFGSGRRT